ncbi:MAG: D-cysteine desulfhydrase family protein [Anaerolineae bacterium]|nr:D-cysteine desulfhydrase family protein [Anaerolineae bacterium]
MNTIFSPSLFSQFSRVPLAFLPTPLQPAPRLSAALGGPRILIKRDDMTGLALGGNKTRKLEFLLADALKQGADVILTAGAPQSNHCRQTAAAARQMGLDCVLVFTPGQHDEMQGNVLLDQILGARIVRTERSDSMAVMQDLADELRQAGHTPYVIPVGGSNAIGTLGYASAMHELVGQLAALDVAVSHLYFSSGSGGTHAGLLLGQHLFGPANMRLVGVSPGSKSEAILDKIATISNEAAQNLGEKTRFLSQNITVYDQFVGPRYGISTPQSLEAISLFAENEGILLDPVYTAKAAAGLIQDIRTGVIRENETVIFLHTGGNPALFAYRNDWAKA